MWVDSHCHLHHANVASSEVDALITRAHQAGVPAMLTVSTCLEDTAKILPLLETYEGVYGSVGVHPHDTDSVALGSLEEALRQQAALHPKMVALGETGLDLYYGHSSAENQRAAFEAHMRVGRDLHLPLIIHTRQAEEETLEIMQRYAGQVRGVIHCFSGSASFAQAVLKLGFYISFSGIVTFPKAQDLRQVVPHVPLDRVLVETDTPYLAPVPYRGKPNEPAYVVETGKILAELYGLTSQDFAHHSTQNFWRFLGTS